MLTYLLLDRLREAIPEKGVKVAVKVANFALIDSQNQQKQSVSEISLPLFVHVCVVSIRQQASFTADAICQVQLT